jgi:hypothetical protein
MFQLNDFKKIRNFKIDNRLATKRQVSFPPPHIPATVIAFDK